MKRVGNLFETIFSKENIYLAYLDARKGKRKKHGCFEFETNLAVNLSDIYTRIHGGVYTPKPYYQFTVYEPKLRTIHAPAFMDIVVQHAIYRIVFPIFDKTFINTSFACRKGMGTHRASDYAQKCLRACSGDMYYLKCDIRKFFASIDRSVLEQLILRKIKDRTLVKIMMLFADIDAETGIPIGNLLSQLYALIYLNPLDHFIKRALKARRYVRYVDDFIVIGVTRTESLLLRRGIDGFIGPVLNLSFSKTTIQKIRKGLNFVGYRTWKSKRFIRKYSLYKFVKCLKSANTPAAISILGHAKWTCSIAYMHSKIRTIGDDTINQRAERMFGVWARAGWHGIRA